MRIGADVRESWGEQLRAPDYWIVRIPLNDRGDYVELARQVGSSVLPTVVAPFVDVLARRLSSKILEQEAAVPAASAHAAVHASS
jgi:hypothetical protein